MFDRLVADGDRTTTGGEVIGRSDFYNEEGKMYARKENHATCGNCKGGWPIYGTASNWMDDGQPYVKDLDRVLCPCGKNFVLAAGGSHAFYSENRDKAKTASPAAQSQVLIYDEQIRATGKGTTVGYPYFIETADGRTQSGRLDSSALLPRITTDAADKYTVYWGDEALAHEKWK